MQNMFSTAGSMSYEHLIAEPLGAVKSAVVLAPGNGVLETGTVLVRDANGHYAPATAVTLIAGSMSAILDAKTDTGIVATGAGPNAVTWVKGIFLKGKVKLLTGTLTAALEGILRGQGIFLKAYMPIAGAPAEVDNVVV